MSKPLGKKALSIYRKAPDWVRSKTDPVIRGTMKAAKRINGKSTKKKGEEWFNRNVTKRINGAKKRVGQQSRRIRG